MVFMVVFTLVGGLAPCSDLFVCLYRSKAINMVSMAMGVPLFNKATDKFPSRITISREVQVKLSTVQILNIR